MDLTVLTEYYFYFIGRCRDIMFPRKPWTVWTTPEVTEDETSTSRTPQMSEISNDDDDQFLLDVASKNSPSRYLMDDTIEISSDESSEPKQSKASVINSIFGGPKSKNSTNSFSKWSKHGNDSNTKYGSKPEFNRKKSWKDYKMESPIKFEEHIKMEETMNAKLPQQSLSIGSVEVHFPVKPYSCQVALMFKVITGISKGQNCLLESPTGSGKTLALLCGALAWQKKEKSRIAAIVEQQYFNNCGDITCEDGADWRKTTEATSSPVKPFTGTAFGVQDTAKDAGAGGSGDFKRPEPQPETDPFNDLNDSGLVKIHKRRKLGDGSSSSEPSYTTTPEQRTPEKNQPACPDQQTPKNLRVPTIYYGARTHKQIQQVIKEFKRTEYCGTTKITILSSREYSCIKKLDKNVHSNKNDMCRDCLAAKTTKNGIEETGCTFYNNRRALCHSSLPLAWDLDELVSVGEELHACPYYAARNMMEIANIVFCPYNYLIDPGIRSAMMINLKDEIVILDEAHNIEDICRDTASLTVTRVEICKAMDEINNMGIYEMGDLKPQLVYLGAVLKAWDNWFNNQAPLLQQSVVNFGESVYTWQVQHFATTLDNHNIGGKELSRFAESVGKVSSVFREDPKRIQGISGVTITLLESMITTFNFMFRNGGLFLDDFKPSLVKTVSRTEESLPDSMGWKSSQYKQQAPQEALSLRLLCMNPAVVFSALEPARTVILSSGTLTPALSMHSELGCKFPLELSTKHVIPHDRVWIGSLLTCPDGEPLECTSRGSDRPSVQDALGRALLWVSQVTPNGVLCFVPSYMLMNKLVKRWQDTKLWQQLNQTKYVFMESRNVRDHNDIMEDYYSVVESEKGALLIAVYRGKVSEGMDFKDKQARAVVTIGIPYPNTYESMVSNKMKYNDAHRDRQLLPGREWLRVQAYRALNQAVGRCVRHKNDWGAVLLIDTRFQQPYYTEHLSKWVRNFLGDNHHSWDSLVNSPNSLESFMQSMTIRETEEQA